MPSKSGRGLGVLAKPRVEEREREEVGAREEE